MLSGCCRCCCRRHGTKYDVERARSKRIDRELERERRIMRRQVKLLLLGAGESGKSTFLKQVRIIHGLQFSAEDLREFRHIIYSNVVQGIRVLCDAHEKLGLPWERGENEAHSRRLLEASAAGLDQVKFVELCPAVEALWRDGSVKELFRRRNLLQVSDSLEWFLDELGRVGGKDYTPSTRDVLLLRRATKGVHQLQLTINGVPFTLHDIGGQRAERAKWVQCFREGGLTGWIFMVAASEWDQFLAEDRHQNRLLEAQSVFSLLLNNRVFRQVATILFLNKQDLLERKMPARTLSLHFPDFHGDPADVNAVRGFIQELFTGVNRVGKELYCHWTTAVDTEQMKLIFGVVRETILRRNLGEMMLE